MCVFKVLCWNQIIIKRAFLYYIFKHLQCECLSSFLLIFRKNNIYFLFPFEAEQCWLPCKYFIDHFKEYASTTGAVISLTVHIRKKDAADAF